MNRNPGCLVQLVALQVRVGSQPGGQPGALFVDRSPPEVALGGSDRWHAARKTGCPMLVMCV